MMGPTKCKQSQTQFAALLFSHGHGTHVHKKRVRAARAFARNPIPSSQADPVKLKERLFVKSIFIISSNMTDYFTSSSTKQALKGSAGFSTDDSRPDLMLKHYKIDRKNRLTEQVLKRIDDDYKQWVDLLFDGFNILVQGPESKFSLVETFRVRYLDSGEILDWETISGNVEKFKRKDRNPKIPTLDVKTVRLHGLDPIRLEQFVYAMFHVNDDGGGGDDNDESVAVNKKFIDQRVDRFVKRLTGSKEHFVFMIHSFDYFQRDHEEICDILIRLYELLPKQIHFVLSVDVINSSKKLTSLKFKLNLVLFQAPYTESFYYERAQLVSDFDIGAKSCDQMLFSDRVELQSLKDVYQALGNTGQIMLFILKDYIEKHEANGGIEEAEQNVAGAQDDDAERDKDGDDSGDDYDDDYDGDDDNGKQLNCNDENEPQQTQTSRQTRSGRRLARETSKKLGTTKKESTKRTRGGRQKRQTLSNVLDFQHLLRHCESQFIVRRGVELRNHLGELVDHNVIALDEAQTSIKCLVDVATSKRFLEFVSSLES